MNDGQFVGIEYDAGSHRVDPQQIDERFYQRGVQPSTPVFPHLAQHLIRRDRVLLIDPSRRCRVKTVCNGDDLCIKRRSLLPHRLRIPRKVNLHVVFMRDDDSTIGNLTVPAQAKESEHTHPGVRLHDLPLFVVQCSLFIQNFDRDPALSHIVHQRGHSKVV